MLYTSDFYNGNLNCNPTIIFRIGFYNSIYKFHYPNTKAIPIPIGKAIGIPEISIAMTKSKFAKLKTTPAIKADRI